MDGNTFAVAAIISSFGTGNMPQVNSIAASLKATFWHRRDRYGTVPRYCFGLTYSGRDKANCNITE